MNNQLILDAINYHDLDGNGTRRVLNAAYKTLEKGVDAGSEGLYCNDSWKCILAHAWDADWVENTTFHRNTQMIPHHFKEVVHWFDMFENHKQAAEAVISLIHDAMPALRLERALRGEENTNDLRRCVAVS